MNPLIPILKYLGKAFKLLMKTPQWLIDIAIALLIIMGAYGVFAG